MATLLPPPSKKQRTAAAEKSREQQQIETIPPDLGNIRVQFFDQSNGRPTGAPVAVPVADATVKNLELLLNTLQRNEPSERVPYRFTFQSGDSALDITDDLYRTLLKPGLKTTEDLVSLQYTPQAIFRVRAVSRCSSSIPGHGEAILATAFSPSSSSKLLTGSGDGTARLWDTDTGTPIRTLKGHTSWVLVVSWSPDDSTIATGSMDNTVRLWVPKTGGAQGPPLKGHTKWVTSLAWEPYHLQAPNRPRLASSSKDSTVRIWDVVSKRIETVLSGHKSSVSCVRWGGTGRIYTASHDKTVKVWDAAKGTMIHTLSSHAHWVNHLALSTDFVLRTAYHDHTNDIPPTPESKLQKAKDRFHNAATINNQIIERLVTASDDYTMYLWEPSTTQKPLSRLHGHQKPINHVSFSPSAHLIASCGWDNHVKLWSARDGAFIVSLRGHVGPVYMACWSADSRFLVSASKDTTIKVWEVGGKGGGRLKEDLPGHRDEVFAVDWSCDGGRVASGGKDKAVRVWRH
ncbi:ribosome assembly [Lecanora helva]